LLSEFSFPVAYLIKSRLHITNGLTGWIYMMPPFFICISF
jgi:hypothetical protein